MAANNFGPFGWFSAAGFVILALLYIVDVYSIAPWPFSATWTGLIALLAGLGAGLLWYGNDPTAAEPRETARPD